MRRWVCSRKRDEAREKDERRDKRCEKRTGIDGMRLVGTRWDPWVGRRTDHQNLAQVIGMYGMQARRPGCHYGLGSRQGLCWVRLGGQDVLGNGQAMDRRDVQNEWARQHMDGRGARCMVL